MKKLILFAAVAGLGLVSASPPPSGAGAQADPAAYPACSRTVTDHCIQLYERGVRAPRATARNAGQPDDELSEVMAAPDDHQARIEMASAAGGTAARPRVVSRRVRRAGERG